MKHIAGFLLLLGIVPMTPSPAVASDHDTGAWAVLSTGDTIYRNGRTTDWRYAFDTGVRLRQQARPAFPVGGGNLSLVPSIEPSFNLQDTDWGAR